MTKRSVDTRETSIFRIAAGRMAGRALFHRENSDQSPKETMPALELWLLSCANSPPRGVFASESSPANAELVQQLCESGVNARSKPGDEAS
jgi:hypothetical protein